MNRGGIWDGKRSDRSKLNSALFGGEGEENKSPMLVVVLLVVSRARGGVRTQLGGGELQSIWSCLVPVEPQGFPGRA